MADSGLVGIISEFLPNIEQNYTTLMIVTLAIAAYSVIIYVFYIFVASRDVFGLNIEHLRRDEEKNFLHVIHNFILSVVKYGLIFPIIVFLWFAGFSLMLFAFSKNQDLEQILIIAITVVSAIRVTSYFREDLAKDLSKLLPLAILGTFLVEPNFFSVDLVLERVDTIQHSFRFVVQFIFFTIILEWVLRIFLFFKIKIFGDHKTQQAKMEAENERLKIKED